MKKSYRQLWRESGADKNGVPYSTFYSRIRYRNQSLKKAARPPQNQRKISRLSCLSGRPRDKN
ncbi:hypothetical protein LKK83_30900, partial [Phormidium sp. CCY1219]|nr:hypothetical protein [Phormidium sp. CCY1219]